MNKEMQIIREVNDEAEQFYQRAERLGAIAADAMGKDRRSQMTGLENIAETALKYTDVFDYIKKQMARFDDWRDAPRKQANPGQPPQGAGRRTKGFGEGLLEELEKLKGTQNNICERLRIENQSDEDKRRYQQIYLQLIRQFIRQVVVHYEYRLNPVLAQVGQKEKNSRGAERRTTA